MTRLTQITLIGVGLIGGSFVLDLKRLQRVKSVIGIDVNKDNLHCALERGVIDVAFTEICVDGIADSELILLAMPVSTMAQVCAQLAPFLSKNAVVSDVGSTKQSALMAFTQYLPTHLPYCVAAHPVAGSQHSGALAARLGLYQNKKLIICPHAQQDEYSMNLIENLWQSVGAEIIKMSAIEHDEVFAVISHLPHLLSFSYVHQIVNHSKRDYLLQFAGSGFADFTRIAASHAQMWTEIALENRDDLLTLLSQQQEQITYLQNCLRDANQEALKCYLQEASDLRFQWEHQ